MFAMAMGMALPTTTTTPAGGDDGGQLAGVLVTPDGPSSAGEADDGPGRAVDEDGAVDEMERRY